MTFSPPVPRFGKRELVTELTGDGYAGPGDKLATAPASAAASVPAHHAPLAAIA